MKCKFIFMLEMGAMGQGHLGTQDFMLKIDLEVTRYFSYLDSKSQLLENISCQYKKLPIT